MDATGKSGIEDQEIAWDERGNPFEIASAKSHGSSVGTRGGKNGVRTRDKDDQGSSAAETRAFLIPPRTHIGRPAAESSQKPIDVPGVNTPTHTDPGSSGKFKKEPTATKQSVLVYNELKHENTSLPRTAGAEKRDWDTKPPMEYSDTSEVGAFTYESDSAWDQDPEDMISEITAKQEENSIRYPSGAGGLPPSDSSSSSDEDKKPFGPRGNP
jgi:hypothetical protein